MKTFLPLSLLLIGLAACTFEKDHDGVEQVKLHNPFAVDKWEVVQQTNPKPGTCVISSGYQGIDIVLTKHHSKHFHGLTGVVVSSRKLEPGNFIRLNVAGHYYETYEQEFSKDDSANIIDDLKTGDVAYVDWNNIHVGDETRRISTIITPTDFAKRYAECSKGAK